MTVTPEEVRLVDFPRVWRRRKGYDEAEVDDFLDRVEATLLKQDTVTPEDVLAVRFAPKQRGKPGYSASAVDAFLEKVALSLIRRKIAATGHTLSDPRVGQSRPALPSGASSRVSPALPASPSTEVRRPAPPPEASSNASSDPSPAPEPVTTRSPLPQEGSTGLRPHPVPVAPGEPAFDALEVDRFVERVEATLRGQDGLSPDEVLAARFRPAQPGHRGYAESNVTSFMVVLATSLRQLSHRRQTPVHPPRRSGTDAPRPLTAEDVGKVTLSHPAPGHRGYALDDVDHFLDRIEQTLRGADRLTADDVRNVRFRPSAPDLGGYDAGQVEALLRRIEHQLDGRQRRQLGA